MTEFVIETESLRKEYGAKVAVADLTLRVPRGEVFGFLGPNGAGKSTSVKMLLGLVAPSGGAALVLGRSPGHKTTMARVGFLPEHFRFHEWLRAAELLDLHGRLLGLGDDVRRRRTPEVLELVGLAEHAQRPIADFSKGMIQRIGLAQALIGEPELVFLDEPTSALDPFGRMLVRGVIRDLKARGTTVFLNSHLLGEVEATCDRAAFIRAGKVIRTIALRDVSVGRVRVALRVDRVSPELLAALAELAADRRPPAAPDEGQPHALVLELAEEALLPLVAERVLGSGSRLYALTPQKLSLEELFLEVVGSEDSGQ